MIGGGEWQTALVRKVKEMGYEVVNSNLYPDSPGFAWADYSEVSDVLDMEKNLAIAKKYGVSAVLTDESDIAVPTVAYVAGKLHLPTIGSELAALYTNKFRMREFCRKHGLNTPEYRLCKTAEEAADFTARIGTAILKPLDAQSSRGVFIVGSPEEAKEHFAESLSHSRSAKAVIAECFIQGTEFTVDGMVVNGKHRCLAISEKKHYAYNESIASELFFSHSNPVYDYEKLKACNDRFVNLSGLPFGFTHAEYKYENGEFYLIEIAARGGGTRISSHIVPLMTGIDNYRCLVETALGHKTEAPGEIPEAYQNRCTVLKFFDVPVNGGIVTRIEGEEEIRNHPGVVELHLEFQVGDRLFRAADDRSRVGFYIAVGESRGELRRTMEWVENTLKIVEEAR